MTDDDCKEWRTFILCELENFVVKLNVSPNKLHVNSVHHQIPRDNTSVNCIDLTKIPVCLYGFIQKYRKIAATQTVINDVYMYVAIFIMFIHKLHLIC